MTARQPSRFVVGVAAGDFAHPTTVVVLAIEDRTPAGTPAWTVAAVDELAAGGAYPEQGRVLAELVDELGARHTAAVIEATRVDRLSLRTITTAIRNAGAARVRVVVLPEGGAYRSSVETIPRRDLVGAAQLGLAEARLRLADDAGGRGLAKTLRQYAHAAPGSAAGGADPWRLAADDGPVFALGAACLDAHRGVASVSVPTGSIRNAAAQAALDAAQNPEAHPLYAARIRNELLYQLHPRLRSGNLPW